MDEAPASGSATRSVEGGRRSRRALAGGLVFLALALLGGLEGGSPRIVRTVGSGPPPGRQAPLYREAVGLLNAYANEAFQNDPRLLANYLTYFRDRFVYVRTIGARQPGHPQLAYDGTPSCARNPQFCAEQLCRMNAYVADQRFDAGTITLLAPDGTPVGKGSFVSGPRRGCPDSRTPVEQCYVSYAPVLPGGLAVLPGDRIRDDSTGEVRVVDHPRLASRMNLGCMTRQLDEVMARRGQVARSRRAVGGYKPWGWVPWDARRFPDAEIGDPIWQDLDHDGTIDEGELVAFDIAWAFTVDGSEHEAQMAPWRAQGWEMSRPRQWDAAWYEEHFDACCYDSSRVCAAAAICPVAEVVPDDRRHGLQPTILTLNLCDDEARRWAVWRAVRILEAMQLSSISHGMKQGWFRVTGPAGPKTQRGCAHTVANGAPYDAWTYNGPAHPALRRRGRTCPGPFHDLGDPRKVPGAYARSGERSWTHCMNQYFRDLLQVIRAQGHGENADEPWTIGHNSRLACCDTRQGILQSDVLADPLWVGEFTGETRRHPRR